MSRKEYVDCAGYDNYRSSIYVTCTKVYVNCKFRFLLSRSALNDDERGKIDSEVQEFISTCTDYIKRIQKLVNACDNAGN